MTTDGSVSAKLQGVPCTKIFADWPQQVTKLNASINQLCTSSLWSFRKFCLYNFWGNLQYIVGELVSITPCTTSHWLSLCTSASFAILPGHCDTRFVICICISVKYKHKVANFSFYTVSHRQNCEEKHVQNSIMLDAVLQFHHRMCISYYG